jgi:hypothetical protein
LWPRLEQDQRGWSAESAWGCCHISRRVSGVKPKADAPAAEVLKERYRDFVLVTRGFLRLLLQGLGLSTLHGTIVAISDAKVSVHIKVPLASAHRYQNIGRSALEGNSREGENLGGSCIEWGCRMHRGQ